MARSWSDGSPLQSKAFMTTSIPDQVGSGDRAIGDWGQHMHMDCGDLVVDVLDHLNNALGAAQYLSRVTSLLGIGVQHSCVGSPEMLGHQEASTSTRQGLRSWPR